MDTNVLPNGLLGKEEGGQPRERGSRAHGGGLGGPAGAVKPRAPRWLSPAQPFMDVFCFYLMSMCSVSLTEIHSDSQLNDGKPKLIKIFCGFLFAKTYV